MCLGTPFARGLTFGVVLAVTLLLCVDYWFGDRMFPVSVYTMHRLSASDTTLTSSSASLAGRAHGGAGTQEACIGRSCKDGASTGNVPAAASPAGHAEACAGRSCQGAAAASAAGPMVHRLKVVNTFAHDSRAFTQGLLYLGKDQLFESTGLYGQSTVRRVELRSGKVLQRRGNKPADFGEGLAYYQGYFWQLIWRKRTVYQYDPVTLKVIGTYETPRGFDYADGWGLASTSDGLGDLYRDRNAIPANESLYVTDSGTKLYKIEFSKGQFKLLQAVTIQTPDGAPLPMANELELISEDELWANVYGRDCIARVDPRSGRTFGWVVADHLRRTAGTKPDVFNGIAYDRQSGRIFVTGKMWSTLYEVELEAEPGLSAQEVKRLCVPEVNVFHPR